MTTGNGGIGASAVRVEDDAFLRGNGRFMDDINVPGQIYAAFVRSPYANAQVRRIDAASVSSWDGVVAVLTPADLISDDVGVVHAPSGLKSANGTPIHNPQQRALTDHPRFVGDTVAMVVAQTPLLAEEAALALEIDYEPIDAVVNPHAALAEDAPLVWPEFSTNLALDWEWGESAAVQAAFDRAAHIARVNVTNNRIMITTLETRGALASFDPGTGRYTLWTPTQGGTQVQLALAKPGLGVAPSAIRVITPDVGGGFGIKNGIYTEQILVAWAARRTGRPVKWYATRSDAFLTDYHARDHRMIGELALDSDGNFLAIRSDVLSNMGAYLTGAAPVIPTGGGTRMLPNVYRVPLAAAHTRCVYTNTTPISAFRGAGKPEYAHLIERLVDQAANDLQMDPAELRRRNMVTPDEMPWRTPTGMVYDSGEFAMRMDEACAAASLGTLEERKKDALGRGKLLGAGFSVYTEPDGFRDNRVEMFFDPSGHLTVITSAQSNGQGHTTAYTQVAQSLLGVERSAITIVEGDTDRTGFASGSGGSRSMTVTGGAMHFNANTLIEKGRTIASHLLESGEGDIEFSDGAFTVAGTDRQVTWVEVAKAAHNLGNLAPGTQPGLEADHHYDAPVYCFPSGCHVCEVEVDIDTGAVEIVRYLSVSDFGTVVNPMLVDGQLQGGIAQGLGQGLYEHTVYEEGSGQLLSGSFMDYCIPRATQLPHFESTMANTTCTTNPLGVKGCGESGPTASLPALANAMHDALRGYNCDELQMPFTPERVWRVLRCPLG
ncbi:MAG: carbon-monoxide dehydrogenase large subunit [Gammaproteobacteria bacterium]|jgi:carbon-monoxide dehydrogenase large subunit